MTGAGGNLGAAVAELLAARGARLVVMDRTESGARPGDWRSRRTRAPSRARPAWTSGIPPPAKRWPTRRLQRFGRIDGLVHTVGAFAMADIDAADPAHWEQLLAANLITTLNICRAVVPAMRAAGRGSIVTVGSAAAARAGKGMAAYAAAKCAVLRLTESLADELKAHRRTRQLRPAQHHRHAAEPCGHAQGRHQPWVTPGQIAEVIAFLLSDAARRRDRRRGTRHRAGLSAPCACSA